MPLLHDDTGTIKSSIPEVFKYLFDTYGNITDQMIHEERAALLQHQYIHDEPVANIFSKIHKYTTLEEAHGTPETDPQLISIGKTILSNARIFADAIENGMRNQIQIKHGVTLKRISPPLKSTTKKHAPPTPPASISTQPTPPTSYKKYCNSSTLTRCITSTTKPSRAHTRQQQ